MPGVRHVLHTRDVQLTWIGRSQRNGQECAVIDYRAFFNPLEVGNGAMTLKGRSHYWGAIWVSLASREIEDAILQEDVLGEMTLTGQGPPRTIERPAERHLRARCTVIPRGGRMTPIGRARLLLVLNGSTTVLVPIMGMGGAQSASDLLAGWAFALVYTNVTAVPALLAGPAIVERLMLRRWPFPAAVPAATTLFVAMGCLAAQSLLMWTGVAAARALCRQDPHTMRGAFLLAVVFGLWRVLVRLDAGAASAPQRREAPRAGARRRAGRAAGRRGAPALARVAAPSALPVQHVELDERAHHDRSPASRPDRGPAVCAAPPVARHQLAVGDLPGRRARDGRGLRRHRTGALRQQAAVPRRCAGGAAGRPGSAALGPVAGRERREARHRAAAERRDVLVRRPPSNGQLDDSVLRYRRRDSDLAAIRAGHGLYLLVRRLDALFSADARVHVSLCVDRCVVQTVLPRS